MKFVDSCEVKIVAGTGGNGAVAFRREKYIPHGGPTGGDGGRGGDVVFLTDPGMSTLMDLTYAHTLKAKDGEHGMGSDCYGRGGAELVCRVPVGTQVVDAATGELLFDLDHPDVRTVVAQGGKGGRGNMHFATPYDRAPRRAEPGDPGEERHVRLELKVMADVGLLGFPNVGKSTFIRAVSRAHPKVADYPFTTLVPHLGVVSISGEPAFVVADIPGLIPGASEGAGLGIRFLKHVERTRALLHLITVDPAEERDPLGDYDAIMKELKAFSPELARRPMVVAVSKADLPDAREAHRTLAPKFKKRGIDLKIISAATGEGVKELLYVLKDMVKGKAAAKAQLESLEAGKKVAVAKAKAPAPAPKATPAKPRKMGLTSSRKAKPTKKKSNAEVPAKVKAPKKKAGAAKATGAKAKAAPATKKGASKPAAAKTKATSKPTAKPKAKPKAAAKGAKKKARR